MLCFCRSGHLLQALVLLSVFVGRSTARSLLQDATCGDFLDNTDLAGNDLGPGIPTESNQACVTLCESTATCNSFTRITTGNGRCFLKDSPVGAAANTEANRVSYRLCPDGMPGPGPTPGPAPGPTPGPTPPPSGGLPCGQVLSDIDLPGANLAPGAGSSSNQQCLARCENTANCNAVVRIPSGRCFLKNVDPDTVEGTIKIGIDSQIVCSGDNPPPPPGPGPDPGPPPPPPPSGGVDCGVVLEDSDLPGANLAPGAGSSSNQECLARCQNTANCNAVVRIPSGRCFLKNVDPDTVQVTTKNGIQSQIICPGDNPPTPPPPPPPPPGMGPGPPPSGGVSCGVLLTNTDLSGSNIETGAASSSNQQCLTRCQNTPPCNAVVRIPSGRCFLKQVNPDTVQATVRNGLNSQIICSDSGPAPAPTPTPVVGSGTASQGSFGPLIPFPLIAVAAAAQEDGKVLVWSGAKVDDFRGGDAGKTFYAVFDTATNTVGPLQSVTMGHDMFCPGTALLPNGDVFIVGGSAGGDGAGSSTLWNGNTFVNKANLQIKRGYNTAVTLATGEVFTLGGSFSGTRSQDKGGEVYNGNAWRLNTNLQGQSILSDDPQGVFRTDNYGFFFAWKQNSVFHAGPSTQMNWFTNLEGAGITTGAGNRGPTAMNGNFVMYEEGKILTVGGAPSFSLGDPARTGAEVITLGAVGAPPNVQSVPGPATARTYAITVVLPTGQVVHFGGATSAVEFSDATAVLSTEVWDPATQSWSVDDSSAVPRTYHSSAVLVPDGRIFVGGGGLCGRCGSVNHLDAQMYSPYYLFDSDNNPASRPTITINQNSVGPGESFQVTGSEPLSMVSMVRMSSSTHSANTDQRRLELCGPSAGACGDGNPNVQVPGAGVAIPGKWMVFGVNQEGVPSVAPIITITT